jgi:hypothetical protein
MHTPMKSLPARISIIILATLCLSCPVVADPDTPSPAHQWTGHIFATTGARILADVPEELAVLPEQFAELGLDTSQLWFGYRRGSFESFSELFDQAMAASPVAAEALTDWERSMHMGSLVHARVYRIGDRGVAIAYFRPNVIVADLGPHDGAVAVKAVLVRKNQ